MVNLVAVVRFELTLVRGLSTSRLPVAPHGQFGSLPGSRTLKPLGLSQVHMPVLVVGYIGVTRRNRTPIPGATSRDISNMIGLQFGSGSQGRTDNLVRPKHPCYHQHFATMNVQFYDN